MDLEAYVSGNVPHLWCSHLGRWVAYRFRLWADRGWIFPALMCLSSLCKMISPDPMARLHRSLTAFLCRSLSPVLNQKDHISPNLRTLYFMLASFWCCVLAYLGQIDSFSFVCNFQCPKSALQKNVNSTSVCQQVHLMWLSQRVNLFTDNVLKVGLIMEHRIALII